MEASESANRRLNCISRHLNAYQQSSSHSSPLATLACSARLDNRALFARQAHMAATYSLANIEPQEFHAVVNGTNLQSSTRRDNRLLFSRQASHTQAFFMRGSVTSQVEEEFDPQPKTTKYTEVLQSSCNGKQTDYVMSKQYDISSSDEPMFSRPQPIVGGPKIANLEPIAKDIGLGWLPRMDVAESRAAYVMTVELPGVNADGIRVEVSNERLLISGTRATEWWGEDAKYDKGTMFRRKELAEGPYRVTWPIPKDIQKNLISAEFVDGFLRILIPKVNS